MSAIIYFVDHIVIKKKISKSDFCNFQIQFSQHVTALDFAKFCPTI